MHDVDIFAIDNLAIISHTSGSITGPIPDQFGCKCPTGSNGIAHRNVVIKRTKIRRATMRSINAGGLLTSATARPNGPSRGVGHLG